MVILFRPQLFYFLVYKNVHEMWPPAGPKKNPKKNIQTLKYAIFDDAYLHECMRLLSLYYALKDCKMKYLGAT